MTAKPKIFVGSSEEVLIAARALGECLAEQGDLDITIWKDAFRLSEVNLTQIEQFPNDYDYGVFIFKPEDSLKLRGVPRLAVRDNVLFEYGLFSGRLGFERTFIVFPSAANVDTAHFATDLQGLNVALCQVPCNPRLSGEWKKSLSDAAGKIRDAILGNRKRTGTSLHGLAEVVPKNLGPLKDGTRFTQAIRDAQSVTITGTSLTDFVHLLFDNLVFCSIRDELKRGVHLRVLLLDNTFDEYIGLRQAELSGTTLMVRQQALDSLHKLSLIKAKWLESEDPVLREAARTRFTLATYRRVPRASYLRVDDRLWVRSYLSHLRGGDAPYSVLLKEGHQGTDDPFTVHAEELQSLVDHAEDRLLTLYPQPQESGFEHREVVHILGLKHSCVHLVCCDDHGHVWLQRRAKTTTRNPGRWTSTVSGHMEKRDNRDAIKAALREAAEEWGPDFSSSVQSPKLVGEIDDLVSNELVSHRDDGRRHRCAARAYVVVAQVRLSSPAVHTEEVESARSFPIRELREALGHQHPSLLGIPMADNFPPVLQMALAAISS